jgi:hypothetical protein
MAAPKLLVAKATFTAAIGKEQRIVSEGDVVKASDPVVKGRRDLFDEVGKK